MIAFALASLTGALLAMPAEDRTDPQARLMEPMSRLAELARTERPIPLDAYGDGAFAAAVCLSQNLAEQGEYGEAARQLSGLIAAGVEPDWKQMLETRVAILERWASSGKMTLEDYRAFYLETGPHWFHGRIRPIIALWKMEGLPRAEKYFLIASLLEKRGDLASPQEKQNALAGAAVVLEAIPGVEGADRAKAARALLMAGEARSRAGDRHGAVRDWSEVVASSPRSPEGYAALMRWGRLYEEAMAYPEAIDRFRMLLESPPDAATASRVVREAWRYHAYHAASGASRCYEALGDYPKALEFAERARTTYTFHSHCGTCIQGEERRLELRLGVLRKRAAEPRAAADPARRGAR